MSLAFKLVPVEQCLIHEIASVFAVETDDDVCRRRVADTMVIVASTVGVCVCPDCADKIGTAQANCNMVNAVRAERESPSRGGPPS